MKKYKISENESLTYDELKERILAFKEPDCDKKYIGDRCCVCLRGVETWFHGQGCTCSNECRFILNKTVFGDDMFEDKKELIKLRRELWRAGGVVSQNDIDKIDKEVYNAQH